MIKATLHAIIIDPNTPDHLKRIKCADVIITPLTHHRIANLNAVQARNFPFHRHYYVIG